MRYLQITLLTLLCAIGCGDDDATDAATDSMSAADTTSILDATLLEDVSIPDGSESDAEADATLDTMPDATTDAIPDASTFEDAGGRVCTSTSPCPEGFNCGGSRSCGGAFTCMFVGACSKDLRTSCGCDGNTFASSSTCVPVPIGPGGVDCETKNCNTATVTCRRAPPVCARGEVPEVLGTCYTGDCVVAELCGCTSNAACPTGYACGATGTCIAR